jgi:hypothetical protein
MEAMKLYIARYGEIDLNANGDCYQGSTDMPLNAKGRAQATALALALRQWTVLLRDPFVGSARLPGTVGVATGRSSHVFQRAKGLPHVVEVTQRRVEFLRLQGDLHLPPVRALAATANIEDERKDGYYSKRDQGSEHGSQR